MLTLLLLRHGKAEAARGDDFARDLTARGERDAGDIGVFLAEHRLVPDVALVSAARRTRRTFELVAERLCAEIEVHEEDALYNEGEAGLRARIGRVEPASRVTMVVGHNPGIMEIAIALAKDGEWPEIERLRGRFPPSGLAVLSFEAEDWPSACLSGGRLDALVFPDDLAVGE